MLVARNRHPDIVQEDWTVAVLNLPGTVNMEQISWRQKSSVEQLAGRPIVRGDNNNLIVELKSGILGVVRPAYRQFAARWIRSLAVQQDKPLSDFLTASINNDSHIVLAMDLRDVLYPETIQERIMASDKLASKTTAHQKLISLISTLQGARLTINFDNETRAEIEFEFGEDVGTVGGYIKPFFLEILSDLHATISDFDKSRVRTIGKSVILQTKLEDENLRRIMSLILTPTPEHQSDKEKPEISVTKPPETDPQTPKINPNETSSKTTSSRVRIDFDASEKYFSSIDRILADLTKANARAKDYQRTATWHDNFARKIDYLPLTGVDPELIKYGQIISRRLTALAASLRGEGIVVDTQQRSVVYDVNVNPPTTGYNPWGGWRRGWGGGWGNWNYTPGSWNVSSNLREVRQKQARAAAEGGKERAQIWGFINEERNSMLQKMREKYGEKFSPAADRYGQRR